MIIIGILSNEVRNDNIGDYFTTIGNIDVILVKDQGDPNINKLIFLHEFIEQWLTSARNISEPEIDKWDREHLDADEPGSLKGAPYRREHLFAEYIEELVKNELNKKVD